jgi:hypothetical protein
MHFLPQKPTNCENMSEKQHSPSEKNPTSTGQKQVLKFSVDSIMSERGPTNDRDNKVTIGEITNWCVMAYKLPSFHWKLLKIIDV